MSEKFPKPSHKHESKKGHEKMATKHVRSDHVDRYDDNDPQLVAANIARYRDFLAKTEGQEKIKSLDTETPLEGAEAEFYRKTVSEQMDRLKIIHQRNKEAGLIKNGNGNGHEKPKENIPKPVDVPKTERKEGKKDQSKLDELQSILDKYELESSAGKVKSIKNHLTGGTLRNADKIKAYIESVREEKKKLEVEASYNEEQEKPPVPEPTPAPEPIPSTPEPANEEPVKDNRSIDERMMDDVASMDESDLGMGSSKINIKPPTENKEFVGPQPEKTNISEEEQAKIDLQTGNNDETRDMPAITDNTVTSVPDEEKPAPRPWPKRDIIHGRIPNPNLKPQQETEPDLEPTPEDAPQNVDPNGETSMGDEIIDDTLIDQLQAEDNNFDIHQAIIERPDFITFLSQNGINDEEAIKNPAYGEKLFKAYEVKEDVVGGLEEIVVSDFEKNLGISIKDKDLHKKLVESINNRAVENPESLAAIHKELSNFRKLEESRVALEERLKGVANTDFAKQLEVLRSKQESLATVEKFGKFWTLRSPLLNDVMYKLGMRNWGPFPVIERGGVRKEIAKIKKEMGVNRFKPMFGGVSKHVREELEKTNKQLNSLTSIESIQALLSESKGKYEELRRSIMEGVGISAAIREVAVEKIRSQFELILNPNTKQQQKSPEFFEKGQAFLDSLKNNPSSFLVSADIKELQSNLDLAIEKIVVTSLTSHIEDLGKKGPRKIPELQKVVNDLISKDSLGSKNKAEKKKFMIGVLKDIHGKVKDSGTGKIRRVFVASLIRSLEKGTSLNA